MRSVPTISSFNIRNVHFHHSNCLKQMVPIRWNWANVCSLVSRLPRNRVLSVLVVHEFVALTWEMHFLCWYSVCMRLRRMAYRSFRQSERVQRRVKVSWNMNTMSVWLFCCESPSRPDPFPPSVVWVLLRICFQLILWPRPERHSA